MKTFTIREFNRIGLKRAPEKDFRDDGNSFRCWTYRNLTVSYLKCEENNKPRYYIGINIPWNEYSFTVDDFINTDWNRARHEFNGCANPDADKLLQNLNYIADGIEALEKEVKNNPVDINKLYEAFEKDCNRARTAMDRLNKEFDWIHADEYKRKAVARAYIRLEEFLANGAPKYEEMPIRNQRTLNQYIEKDGFVHASIHSYTKDIEDVLR